METFKINLQYNQILELVRQLPRKDKIRLTRELEKEMINSKLTSLLKSFKTDELEQKTIDREVEIVREELHGRSKAN